MENISLLPERFEHHACQTKFSLNKPILKQAQSDIFLLENAASLN